MTHAKKGKTVMNEYERAESLKHCKWVDQVIEHAPWIIDQDFLDKHEVGNLIHLVRYSESMHQRFNSFILSD